MPTFSSDDFSLSLEGTLGSAAGELFTVNLIDNDDALSSINVPYYVAPYVTEADGIFNINILLPTTIASGKWYVKVDSIVATPSNSFIIVNPTDTNTIRLLASVKASTNASELYSALNANSAGVDDITYVGFDKPQNLSEICDVLYYELKNSNENVQTIDTDDFYHAFRRVLFFTDLKGGADFDTAITTYADSMAISSSGEYTSLAADVKESFKNIFVTSDYTAKSLKELFADSMFFVKFKALETLGECETLITANAGLLTIDMGANSKYQKIPNDMRYKVFQKICESKDSLAKTSEVKSLFDTTVNDVLDSLDVPKFPVSSGRGSSSSVKVDTNYTQDMPVTIVPEPQPLFDDIADSFAKAEIEALAKDGIISGYADGSFKPQNNVTRAEFVTLIVRALGIEQGADNASFADVSFDEWYYDAVAKMASNAYISGYNGCFNPDSTITRQDAAVIIYNVLAELLSDLEPSVYNDAEQISEYAIDAIDAVSAVQIMKGYENNFRPTDFITRAETAVLISNVLSFLDK
ncbi:MAG: S-layer homology domain-containing protein [Clostridia bacterium]|nr:S-layer homology domain-containing protein [Clostridia bacterium]